jgi:hypothetical protein
MGEEQPWRRRKGEGVKAYQAFLAYRDMGPRRSVGAVAPITGSTKTAKENQHHWWRQWAGRYDWRKRAEAWDDHVNALAADKALETQLAARVAEQEENARQRLLRIREARMLRQGGGRVWSRFLTLVQEGALDKLIMERVKRIEVLRQEGGSEQRYEHEAKGITELLDLAERAIEMGHKLERAALTEDREGSGDTGNEAEIVIPASAVTDMDEETRERLRALRPGLKL